MENFKKCECGKVWCDSCKNQHKQCECGKFFHKNFDLCPYCHDIEMNKKFIEYYKNRSTKKIIQEYHENGEIKSEGRYSSVDNCTSWGGPLDCRIIGGPCVECVGSIMYKDGLWKYYYSNGKLKMEGEYSDGIYETGLSYNGQRNGVWKVYDKNGGLSNELMYKNGEIV